MNTSSENSDGMTPSPPIITLLSDFGLSDPYVASLKAVVLSICRRAVLIDITHLVPKFDILQGAYLLAASVPYFPVGTIHLCVVDPGVGTNRRELVLKTKRGFLIGPDNGVLMLAADKEGIERVIEIRNERYMLNNVSSTFHGRDVFASVAAHLAEGVSIDEFGPEIEDYLKLASSKPSVVKNTVLGQIVHVDEYGNIVTNISIGELEESGIILGSMITVVIGSVTRIMELCKTYGDTTVGKPLALIGSTGFLEISINRASAASNIQAETGARVTISSQHPRKHKA